MLKAEMRVLSIFLCTNLNFGNGGNMEAIKAFWANHGETTVIVFACVLAVALLIVALVNGRKGKFTTRMITVAAMSIALSMVLNLLPPLWQMPNGGSVTWGRLVPLVIFAYIYGFGRGCIVGAIYGVLDFIMEPFVAHPVSFLLDYPLAFAMVGLAGLRLFKGNKTVLSLVIGTCLAGVGRFAMSSISGTIFYGVPLLGSMAYNSALLVDMALCLAVILLLTLSKSFMHFVELQRKRAL